MTEKNKMSAKKDPLRGDRLVVFFANGIYFNVSLSFSTASLRLPTPIFS